MSMESVNTWSWSGNMTLENMPAIADAIEELLSGKQYAFVANVFAYSEPTPDVRVNQRLCPEKATDKKAINLWHDENSPPQYGGFHVVDTYGVWGCMTGTDEPPHFYFEWSNRVTITQRSGSGHKIIWRIVTHDGPAT